MVALVGPNEAGKSSLLRAMTHIGDSDGFDENEYPRRRPGAEPRLVWTFELDDDDRQALQEIPDTGEARRVEIAKSSDGRKTWAFRPHHPVRDKTPRAAAHATAETLTDEVRALTSAQSDSADLDFEHVLSILRLEKPNLSEEEVASLLEYGEAIMRVAQEAPNQGVGDPSAVDEGQQGGPTHIEARLKVEEFGSRLIDLAAHEAERAPAALAIDALQQHVPEIRLFEPEDRELASEYDLTQVADSPPAALMHLASLAGLDLPTLRDEAVAGRIADVATRRNAANRVLLNAFDKSWNQQGIAVQIDIQGTLLHVQATTPEDDGLSTISERSDGMRWFAALLAYAHGWKSLPILLVDEIETHLHYDAQADLIEVLSRQEFTSKVIFTTHSFGCLPHDLGTGVRVVEQVDAATSRLENGFWKRGAGFSPLLAAMGAAATSLTPTRHAALGEGPSEAILLPTLLREANSIERLQFQVAPGLSSVAASEIGSLGAEAGRVAFLVDGDTGGEGIATKLIAAGVQADQITRLHDTATGDALTLEDLIDPAVYASALNDEIQLWQEGSPTVRPGDIEGPLCARRFKVWAKDANVAEPDKVAVSQRVVEKSTREQPVFNATRQETLQWLLSELMGKLGLHQDET